MPNEQRWNGIGIHDAMSCCPKLMFPMSENSDSGIPLQSHQRYGTDVQKRTSNHHGTRLNMRHAATLTAVPSTSRDGCRKIATTKLGNMAKAATISAALPTISRHASACSPALVTIPASA